MARGEADTLSCQLLLVDRLVDRLCCQRAALGGERQDGRYPCGVHRDWVLEELYIEGLRSLSCAEHALPLLSADRAKNSLFAARKYEVLAAAAAALGNSAAP